MFMNGALTRRALGQWIVVDAKVYDLTRFAGLHPGGAAVLYAQGIGMSHPLSHCISSTHTLCTYIAGKDATQAFFGLHRHEVLLRPQYARLQIGTLKGASELISAPAPDALSAVPYAEPTWLSKGFHSPYFTDSHKRFQKAVRKFIQEVVFPEAIKCEEKGTRISQEVVDKLAYAKFTLWMERRTLKEKQGDEHHRDATRARQTSQGEEAHERGRVSGGVHLHARSSFVHIISFFIV
jgi:hypothetical protein